MTGNEKSKDYCRSVLFQTILRLARTTLFRFTDVKSFVSITRSSRSKLFFLSDSLLDNKRGVLLLCEKNELSGALVKARDRPPKRVRLELISKMAAIADETWTLHLQPPKTKKG